MVRLGNSAPIAILPKERHEVVDIRRVCLEIQDQGLLPVHPERERRQQCTLHAVRSVATQRHEGRHARLRLAFLVDRNRVEEILNSSRAPEGAQDLEFRKVEHVHLSSARCPSSAAIRVANRGSPSSALTDANDVVVPFQRSSSASSNNGASVRSVASVLKSNACSRWLPSTSSGKSSSAPYRSMSRAEVLGP